MAPRAKKKPAVLDKQPVDVAGLRARTSAAAEQKEHEEEPEELEEFRRSPAPLPAATHPPLTALAHFCRIWLMKIIAFLGLRLIRLLRPAPPETRPSFTRRYACRPGLEVRFFVPPPALATAGLKEKEQTRETPLYIDIHGGGFAVGDAELDDAFCSGWARRTGMLVASLSYRKAPRHPVPTAAGDVAALAAAVIADDDLPRRIRIDRSRVVCGGFSAGGNLCLAASLLAPLSGKVRAAVSYYPIVDFSSPPHQKYADRLYKGGRRAATTTTTTSAARSVEATAKGGAAAAAGQVIEDEFDSIATSGPCLDWGYVPVGHNRKDPVLSPRYAARRDQLPPSVCLVGAQHDMLCREAREMAHWLARRPVPARGAPGWEDSWEDCGRRYKWVLAKGARHAFAEDFRREKSARADRRREFADGIFDDVHRWLRETVLV
ncbi:hypothetical protein SLS62_011063 [Diatrype stigma]|uniref:Alpha/beta hydrolase fold-3 domain-containing protein n=1 Tax=Diatrype stigma TaxID=117547 RepID=A0AAN9U632_9PEZI